jgi:integrase
MRSGRGKAWVEPHRERFRVRAIVDGSRKTVASYADEPDATDHAEIWNSEIAEGTIAVDTGATLAEYGAEWLKRREVYGSRRRERVKSIASELSAWSRHVRTSDLAAMHLTSIRTADVEDFARELRVTRAVSTITTGPSTSRKVQVRTTGRTLSRATQREALRLVRDCLAEALRAGIITTNPALNVHVALGARAPRDLSEDWLRADEIDALLGCDRISIRDRTAYACALGLALRLGDLLKLEVGQVFMDAEVPGPHVKVLISKTQKQHRVPVAAWLAPWLRAHLATLPKDARYVFPNAEGSTYGNGYEFAWAAKVDRGRRTPSALERAGVKRKVRFHDLRGTTATHLALGTWGRTWSLHEIQGMLAHSDQRVTERYVRRAIDPLAQAMRDTPGGPAYSVANSPERPRTDLDAACNPAKLLGSESRTRTCDHPVNSATRSSVISDAYGRRGRPGGVAAEILAAVASGALAADLARRLATTVLNREKAVELAAALLAVEAEPEAAVEPPPVLARTYEVGPDGKVVSESLSVGGSARSGGEATEDLRRGGRLDRALAVECASSVAFPEIPTARYQIDGDGSAVRTPLGFAQEPTPEVAVGVGNPERARP